MWQWRIITTIMLLMLTSCDDTKRFPFPYSPDYSFQN